MTDLSSYTRHSVTPDPTAENILRKHAGLPELTEDEIVEREAEDEQQAELDRKAQEAALQAPKVLPGQPVQEEV